ncbi:MAG: hypothetical protein ACLFVR_12515 [Thiohalospira sp.]
MRKLVFLLMLFVGCNQGDNNNYIELCQNNDLDKKGLKGKVKSIKTSKYIAIEYFEDYCISPLNHRTEI